MFFCDLEGPSAEAAVAEAIEALRAKAESVRVLGSYPLARRSGIPGAPEGRPIGRSTIRPTMEDLADPEVGRPRRGATRQYRAGRQRTR